MWGRGEKVCSPSRSPCTIPGFLWVEQGPLEEAEQVLGTSPTFQFPERKAELIRHPDPLRVLRHRARCSAGPSPCNPARTAGPLPFHHLLLPTLHSR